MRIYNKKIFTVFKQSLDKNLTYVSLFKLRM